MWFCMSVFGHMASSHRSDCCVVSVKQMFFFTKSELDTSFMHAFNLRNRQLICPS